MKENYVILLRHGDYRQKADTPSALQPFALTDQGVRQARAAGQEISHILEHEGWTLSRDIYCSRQLRAWQTAQALSESLTEKTGLSFRIIENEAIAERSVGALANLTLQEIETILDIDPRCSPPPKDWKSNSHYKLPVQGAESLVEAGKRLADFISSKISELDEEQGPNVIIFVGHGASMRHAAHHLGILEFDQIRQLSMHHARPVVLKRNDTSSWSHHSGAWKKRTPADTALD